MKKITKRILAFLAVGVITISAAGVSASARAAVPDLQDGWDRLDNGWTYLAPESKHMGTVSNDVYKIDGILYRFYDSGLCAGKYSGMTKSNGISRRYENGLPYTGWIKSKNDNSRKYYLDGYFVTGDFPIDGKVYSFDENGILTGSKKAKFTADCGGKISSDTDMFRIKICYNINDTSEFFAYDPKVMERWENGRWVNCRDTASEFVTDDCLATIKYSKSDTVHFYPQDYTGNKFTPGYYRLKMNVNNNIFYAVFEVLPPVTVDFRKDYYISDGSFDVPVETVVTINSEKLKEYYSGHTDGIGVEILYNDGSKWKQVKTGSSERMPAEEDGAVEAEASETGSPMNIFLVKTVPGVEKAGHYKAVVTVNGKKYTREFLIDKLSSKAWLDEYYSKDDKLTVNFTLFNNTKKDITINQDVYTVYEQKDGKWEAIHGEVAVDALLRDDIIKAGGEYVIEFPMYQFYIDRSKFKPGTYAVEIGGWGFAEFYLTDKKPDLSETPYMSLSEDNIEKIQLNTGFSGGETLSAEFTGYEARQLVHILRQISIYGDAEETFSTLAGTFRCEIKMIYNDGKTKTVVFRDSDILEYKGKKVFCHEYPYRAIEDILDRKPDVERSWEKIS